MSQLMMCAICHKATQRSKLGALSQSAGRTIAICLHCWDTDPQSLIVYQMGQVPAPSSGEEKR